ncbi:SIR2 family NAD-dependent protein deacylase [Aromatoleum evansii]|uniref:SIR2 family NAD-dependent protein deacylase n=1 Tax=Aromatoleum evansii TaxID=59406 RepID=UPI00145CA668|nr:NAD-dependent deacylase [Aromatoleum evansii]NMG31766.1 NAD-dependent protein deacylase [Aromatoleum evansii]
MSEPVPPAPLPTPSVTKVPAALVDALRSAQHVVVLTGAGVSAESGIPTFRDAMTGLWERFAAEDLATREAFRRDPELVWGWYEWRRMRVLQAQPNPAHIAIAEIQRHSPRFTLITQNVDDLHERAGSVSVVHLHGSLHRPRCFTCGEPHDFPTETPLEPDGGRRLPPPSCPNCGGKIRPGVVWFGEALPELEWMRARHAALQCNLFISVGTSSLVYPAADLPHFAASRALIVQVNPHPTSLNKIAKWNLSGAAGIVLPEIVAAAWGET